MEIPEAKKKSMDLALMWINSLPTSEVDFKKRTARYLDAINKIEESMVFKRGGYSMTKETIDKYNSAVATLVNVALNAGLSFSEDDHIKNRLSLTQQAFDRHLATCYSESERAEQFELFRSELESQLDLAALSGSIKDGSKFDSLSA